MQWQKLVATSTSGHDLPKLLLVLVPDSYLEGVYPSYASAPPPTPHSVAQFLYSLKQVTELDAASVSPLSEPGWHAGRINTLNLTEYIWDGVTPLQTHCVILEQYKDSFLPSESPQLQYFCVALQTLIRVFMKCSWFEVKCIRPHKKNNNKFWSCTVYSALKWDSEFIIQKTVTYFHPQILTVLLYIFT